MRKTLSLCITNALIGIVVAVLAMAVTVPAYGGSGHEHHQHHTAPPAPTEAVALPGLAIPDTAVLDQDGNQVRFYTDLVKDRVVAVNFIFTTCTTICPPMGANFAKLQKLMGERVGRDFYLISVSVDPAVDTPARLKKWAEKFGRGPGWTLVTGSKPEIDTLLKALKVFTPDKNDHSPIVLVGDDARAEWTRAYGLAPASTLAEMSQALLATATVDVEEGR